MSANGHLQSLSSSHTANNTAFLTKWGAENMDDEVLSGKIGNTWEIQRLYMESRGIHMAKTFKDGTIIIVCGGVRCAVPAYIVTQTSALAREMVDNARKDGKAFPEIVWTVDDSASQYLVDRLVKYFWDMRLTIRPTKAIECAVTPPTDPEHSDVTKKMSSLHALIQLFKYASELKDTYLQVCVLAKLRYTLHYSFFDIDEYIDGVREVYAFDMLNSAHRCLQSIFLTAAVKHSLALTAGPKRTLFMELKNQVARFDYEYTLGLSWFMYVKSGLR